MWRPQRSVPLASQSGIALLAVQTGASYSLDYVLVAGVITRGRESWIVGHANGGTENSQTKVLSTVPSTATSEDIALRTNGSSQRSVYFGDMRAVRITVAEAGDRSPLEVEELGMAYVTQFQHFSVSAGTSGRVAGLHPGDRVSLTTEGHATLHATANATGEARVQLPLTDAVGKGTLTIDGSHLRHKFRDVAFAGGDLYSVTS